MRDYLLAISLGTNKLIVKCAQQRIVFGFVRLKLR